MIHGVAKICTVKQISYWPFIIYKDLNKDISAVVYYAGIQYKVNAHICEGSEKYRNIEYVIIFLNICLKTMSFVCFHPYQPWSGILNPLIPIILELTYSKTMMAYNPSFSSIYLTFYF